MTSFATFALCAHSMSCNGEIQHTNFAWHIHVHVWYNFFETWAKYWPFIDVSVSCQPRFGPVLVYHELEVMTLAVVRFLLKLPMVRECPYFHVLNFTSSFGSNLRMHIYCPNTSYVQKFFESASHKERCFWLNISLFMLTCPKSLGGI